MREDIGKELKNAERLQNKGLFFLLTNDQIFHQNIDFQRNGRTGNDQSWTDCTSSAVLLNTPSGGHMGSHKHTHKHAAHT